MKSENAVGSKYNRVISVDTHRPATCHGKQNVCLGTLSMSAVPGVTNPSTAV